MKKIVITMFLTLLIASLIINAAFAAEIIRYAHGAPTEDPRHLSALEFKRVIEEETKGKYSVQIFPAGQIGTDVDLVESVQTGSLEIVVLPPAFLSGFQPLATIVDLPYLFPVEPELSRKVMDGKAGQAIFKSLEEVGLKGLCFQEGCYKHFTANKPLTKPDDFKGLKFRVMPSAILIAMIESLGANAITIPYTEVYMALQTNAIDGQEANLVSIYNMKFHEPQAYLMKTFHIKNDFIVFTGKQWWDGLDSEMQKIMEKAIKAGKEVHDKMYWEMENAAEAKIAEEGKKVVELTPEELQVLKETTASVQEVFVQKYGEKGQEMLELFKNEINSIMQEAK